MSRKEKLVKRSKMKPADFTFSEAETLLGWLGYHRFGKGKTSGSRVIFKNELHGDIVLHKPHPNGILKQYQIRQLIEQLEKEGLI